MRKLKWSASRPTAPPPVERRRTETTLHGVTLSDDYAWLKAANWQEVLRAPAALPGDIWALIETVEYASTFPMALTSTGTDFRVT